MIRWTLQRKAAAKSARKACQRMSDKHHRGAWLTVRYAPDWDTEKGVVDEELREERKGKRIQ